MEKALDDNEIDYLWELVKKDIKVEEKVFYFSNRKNEHQKLFVDFAKVVEQKLNRLK